jgi:hypothetical protein
MVWGSALSSSALRRNEEGVVRTDHARTGLFDLPTWPVLTQRELTQYIGWSATGNDVRVISRFAEAGSSTRLRRRAVGYEGDGCVLR